MKIIDAKGRPMGRVASYAAKQALKGEEIAVVNCAEAIITGNKKMIEESFKERRSRVGHSQKGPKVHKASFKIVKRSIRGMLPDHRVGRGRTAWKKIKCYDKIPKEMEGKDMVKLKSDKKVKFVEVRHLGK
jgi:large subunit ribosomal protein L13